MYLQYPSSFQQLQEELGERERERERERGEMEKEGRTNGINNEEYHIVYTDMCTYQYCSVGTVYIHELMYREKGTMYMYMYMTTVQHERM